VYLRLVGRHYSSVIQVAPIASQELVMLDYQRVTARIDSRQCASSPAGGALASILIIGLLTGCSGGKASRDESAAPPPPPPAEEAAPAAATEPAAQATEEAAAETSTSQPVLNPSAPQKYVVQRGDTLWDIASKFLRDPWFWPEIWYVNPQIENPHLIYPGDTLSLGVGANGQPVVSLERGANARLSPQMRGQPLEDAIKAIPYEIIAAFMSKPSVFEKGEAKKLPYVLTPRDHHLVAGVGNEIYVMNLQAEQNSRFSIVRVGDPLVDPDDNHVVGYQGIYTGSARVERPGQPAKLALTESARETREGDRVVSDSLDVPLDFVPHAPDKAVNGRIISVIDGVTIFGAFQVVVVNRGSSHGLEPGHVLAVFEQGEKVRDLHSSTFTILAGDAPRARVRLPDERAGTFMVFKTYDRISYGLIMTADHPLHVGDVIGNP
jgi:hypothetical protein